MTFASLSQAGDSSSLADPCDNLMEYLHDNSLTPQQSGYKDIGRPVRCPCYLFIDAPSIVHWFVSERRDIGSGVTECVEQLVSAVSWVEFPLGVFDIDSR